MDFQFREMAAPDKPQVLEFLKRHFGAASVQCRKHRFEWQFQRYPGGSRIHLCFHRDKLVAQSCFLPVTLQLGRDRVSAACSIDTMVDPEFRRIGIGEMFHQIRLDTFQVALSSGQSEANANLYQKMGWPILGRYFEFKLMRRVPRLQKPKSFVRDIINYAQSRIRLKKHIVNPQIVVSTDCPEELRNHLDRGKENEAFIRIEDDYLNWRYRQHPYFKYTFIQVIDGDKWLGACVARLSKPGHCRIVDYYCPRENLPALLEGMAHSLDAYCIEGELAGLALREHFLRTGFSVVMTNQRIMGSSKDRQIRESLSRYDWLMFGGDSDNDR